MNSHLLPFVPNECQGINYFLLPLAICSCQFMKHKENQWREKQFSYWCIIAITGFCIARLNCIEFSVREAFLNQHILLEIFYYQTACQHSNLMCAQCFHSRSPGSSNQSKKFRFDIFRTCEPTLVYSRWTLSHFALSLVSQKGKMVRLFCLVWTHPVNKGRDRASLRAAWELPETFLRHVSLDLTY